MSGYEFDPHAAKQIEKGLKDAIAELEEVGLFSITSQQGHGFSRMSLSGMTLGDAALADKFEEFCDRWGAAVSERIHDANQLALGLGLNAGLYHEQEEYVVGTLKELAASAAANDPAAGMSAGEGAADKSWTQIGQESVQAAQRDKPVDYSLPDFDEMGEQWEKAGDDAETSPLLPGSRGEWQWDGDPAGRQGQGGGAGGGQQGGSGGAH
ncbi:hypothetical protein HCC61_05675 [Streptomyces sp. HNM0575]|uniref:hypothetical protein n=1 Tax=Streptomyces sp. HNM0575 TaxID=2716338 RepID=UPI00145FCFDF|nr:hypothetical protein [Streptomyces sp. HNM0575]NLU72179.1 hypothetical protein [Streptomyces sp. HNM0575]